MQPLDLLRTTETLAHLPSASQTDLNRVVNAICHVMCHVLCRAAGTCSGAHRAEPLTTCAESSNVLV